MLRSTAGRIIVSPPECREFVFACEAKRLAAILARTIRPLHDGAEYALNENGERRATGPICAGGSSEHLWIFRGVGNG